MSCRRALVWVSVVALAAIAGGSARAADGGGAADGGRAHAAPPAAERSPASRPATTRPVTSRPASRPASRPTSLPAWAPKLRASVKPAVAHVGDPIAVTIVVIYRKGISVTLPLKLELGDFSELRRQERREERGPKGHIPRVEHTFELQVAAYQLGRLTLPPIEVNALGPGDELLTLRTEALPILIKTVMPNEPNPELKPVEEPVPVFERTWWLLYLSIGLAVVAVVVVATLLINRRIQARRRAAKPPPPPVPPHETALRRLEQLDVDGLIADKRFKDLYLSLSEIIREYVGGRWQFDALEMTTTEIVDALEQRSVASEVRQRLQLFFNNCDLVKFAKYRPEPQMAHAAAAEAERLVRDTVLLLPPAAPSPPAASDDDGAAAEAADVDSAGGGERER